MAKAAARQAFLSMQIPLVLSQLHLLKGLLNGQVFSPAIAVHP